MKGENSISRLFVSVILIAFLVALLATPASAQQAVVSISPPAQNVSFFSNSQVVVNVSIKDVNGLYGYQFDVSYNSSVLVLAPSNSVTEGSFLKKDGNASFWIPPSTLIPGLIDNAASSRYNTTVGVSGAGNLTQIRFILNSSLTNVPTTTQIKLMDVKLSNISNQPIPFTVYNGTVNVKICLSGETKSCGNSIGECEPGTQTCSNYQWGSCVGGVGPVDEICDNKDNDCDGQTDESLTRSCSIARYGICAQGSETCTSGNWAGCPLPQTEICWNNVDEDCNGQDSTCQGDIAGGGTSGDQPDGCIDISDLVKLASNFGKTGSSIKGDIDNNGVVDVYDLVTIGKEFGTKSSTATC